MAAYLVWTVVSSVVKRVTGRLTAAGPGDQQRIFVSLHDSLWCLFDVLSRLDISSHGFIISLTIIVCMRKTTNCSL